MSTCLFLSVFLQFAVFVVLLSVSSHMFCFSIVVSLWIIAHTGTPRHISYAAVLKDLQSIEGVRLAHSLYIWSLTLNKSALAAHLAVGKYLSIKVF